jgi:TPR repeat protein
VQRLDPDEIGRLIKRGQQYLQTGDIASARLMFRRAADEGSAPAALALGATFDPLILREIGVLGLGPNVAQARSWYQKAAELGSNEAARRIEQLGNPR